jgi:hypothetical protein
MIVRNTEELRRTENEDRLKVENGCDDANDPTLC